MMGGGEKGVHKHTVVATLTSMPMPSLEVFIFFHGDLMVVLTGDFSGFHGNLMRCYCESMGNSWILWDFICFYGGSIGY